MRFNVIIRQQEGSHLLLLIRLYIFFLFLCDFTKRNKTFLSQLC